MWCFALVNNKLAEIYFDKGRKETRIYGHAYVDRKEFRTKREKKWIEEDTKKFQFSFRDDKYKSKLDDKMFSLKTW